MNFTTLYIDKNKSILTALKQMDDIGYKLLIVVDQDKFLGLISIGDIQRSILNNNALDVKIINILRENYKVADETFSIKQIKEAIFEIRAEFMPVINSNNEVIKVYFWKDFFEKEKKPPRKKFHLPVIVMAGGLGTRLKPLTNIFPKPLMPYGEKTILEEIIKRFGAYGCNNFHVSINYKADLIKFYINTLSLPVEVSFFEEPKPLGTAGSLSLLKEKITSTFFVSNCDIIIDEDYSEILEYHNNNNNEITIVSVLKHFQIAYGTIESGKDGLLERLKEKPELNFKINSGMYILEPHLLKEIPDDQFYHITHLIEKLHNEGRKVGVFPISEKSWTDIGMMSEYIKTFEND